MSRSPARFAWPVLCVSLVAALAGSTIYWKRQVRVAMEKKKEAKAPRRPVFDKRDAAFFQGLAVAQRYETKGPLTGGEAAKLAAYQVMELNKHVALRQELEPPTVSTRERTFRQRAVFPLAATMPVQLAEPVRAYRYELTNQSDHALPAPILFRDVRWDSAAALVDQAGFKAIPSELERAVAIWRFVCSYRVFGEPPTEGNEEHDVVKFFTFYGYGFCDDAARALAMLAELSGLKSRVWELGGHVVAEVMADGRWRMFDADQECYFQRAEKPLDILGVEDLAADKSAFAHMVSTRKATAYEPRYMNAFLDKRGNLVTAGGAAGYRIQPVLRAGEQMTFTNYNWGRYFLGKFPVRPPRYYNGSFSYRMQARDLIQGNSAVKSEAIDDGFRLENGSGSEVTLKMSFAYPFPIVGGVVDVKPLVKKGTAQITLEDDEHHRALTTDLRDRGRLDLNYFVAILTSDPTHEFTLSMTLGPKTVVELRNFWVVSDFQFAHMALVPLTSGANELHAHFPEKSEPGAFEFAVSWE